MIEFIVRLTIMEGRADEARYRYRGIRLARGADRTSGSPHRAGGRRGGSRQPVGDGPFLPDPPVRPAARVTDAGGVRDPRVPRRPDAADPPGHTGHLRFVPPSR